MPKHSIGIRSPRRRCQPVIRHEDGPSRLLTKPPRETRVVGLVLPVLIEKSAQQRQKTGVSSKCLDREREDKKVSRTIAKRPRAQTQGIQGLFLLLEFR